MLLIRDDERQRMMKKTAEKKSNKFKILIIDDDRQFMEDLKFLLNESYQVSSARESRTGIALMEEKPFDLVLLDLKMPSYYANEDEREGLEVLKLIKLKWGLAGRAKIPVIMLTRDDSPESRRRCLHNQADGFFTKPPDIETLKQKINELLASN
jgi:CheY-like chemotaxis protein